MAGRRNKKRFYISSEVVDSIKDANSVCLGRGLEVVWGGLEVVWGVFFFFFFFFFFFGGGGGSLGCFHGP